MAAENKAKMKMSDSLSNIPENISLKYLPDHVILSEKSKQRGLNYYTQGYIHNVKISDENTNNVYVSAKCWPSMRKSQPPHILSLEIDRQKEGVVDAYCSCKAGTSGHCSHVIGLIKTLQGFKLHNFNSVPVEQSCTSVPQQWHVPRGSKIKPIPVSQVIVARPTENRKRKPVLCNIATDTQLPQVTDEDIKKLASLKGTPLQHRMSVSVPLTATSLGNVQFGSMLTYQTKHMKLDDQSSHDSQPCGDTTVTNKAPVKLPAEFYFLNDMNKCLNPEKLETETRCQSSSSLWFNERQNRLTSSNFGKIIKRKSQPNEKFGASLFLHANIHAKSIDYGKRHEKVAKESYLMKFPSRHLHECGLIINNEYSFLGASPDGKLCDQGKSGIIEIKCPFSARNLDLSQACDELRDFCLHKNIDGNILLKRDHIYYYQVQGQLLVTGCEFCEFILFTQKELHVERIKPDFAFMETMLTKLATFFRDYGLPYLSNAKMSQT